jgi:arabinose-5-phosphate isomerase
MMVIRQAKEVLQIEAESILNLVEKLGASFEECVSIILASKGRVILTGMGKSGLVARKIAATLNSTGTPSLFLHPAEAIHGDLGMVTRQDIALAISNSGQTGEINKILPILKRMGARVIAFTGRLDSPMAQLSDIVIDVSVEREACPMGLAPTASTTAALAMGDALAVALLKARRFSRDDFRRFHPGGSLGDRLGTRVKEVMLVEDHMPMVFLGTTVRAALTEISRKNIGAALVVDTERRLAGILTDGDVRRGLLAHGDVLAEKVEALMTPDPKTIDENQTAAEALGIMELYEITHLVILDPDGRVRGIVHLHDLLGREDFRLNGGAPNTSGTVGGSRHAD